MNIGAAARAMSNFGFLHLRLVNAYDIAYQEARSAVGAFRLLKEAECRPSVADAVADSTLVVGTASIGHRQLKHPLRRLEYGGRLIRRHLAAGGKAALLFGSEKFGLSNEDMAHCHWLLRIPTRMEHESMNLGQAVAVCLYELVRDSRAAIRKPEATVSANAGDVERFTVLLLELLEQSGYLNPRATGSSREKVRRLVRRLALPARDIEQWQGMIRQALWRIKEGKD